MRLQLFDFIDETIEAFDIKRPAYEYVEGQLKAMFSAAVGDKSESIVSLKTRIKSSDSLREKLIRNRFYLTCNNAMDALEQLTDTVGITIQCRFIRNEAEIYKFLFHHFIDDGNEFSQCKHNPDVYLNLRAPQPQTQRNGFTIYRLDGYYVFNGERINFELQIKSLVHSFWSEIEHEVVYKNPDYVMNDTFNKNMLGAIRDNLDTVDRQLEIMYNNISYQSQQAQIGMDEKGFKVFVSRSINELVNRKMKDSLGFVTDFKQCSAILAQYIYVHDFVNGEHNPEKMIDFLQLLNLLMDTEINFQEEIELEHPYTSSDPFCDILGKYWQSQMNVNFQWHVFFCMLFTIQPGNNIEDLEGFVGVIRILLIQPGWFNRLFKNFEREDANVVRDDLSIELANALVSIGKIDIIHEEKVHTVMETFRQFCDKLDQECFDYETYQESKERILSELSYRIKVSFR